MMNARVKLYGIGGLVEARWVEVPEPLRMSLKVRDVVLVFTKGTQYLVAAEVEECSPRIHEQTGRVISRLERFDAVRLGYQLAVEVTDLLNQMESTT